MYGPVFKLQWLPTRNFSEWNLYNEKMEQSIITMYSPGSYYDFKLQWLLLTPRYFWIITSLTWIKQITRNPGHTASSNFNESKFALSSRVKKKCSGQNLRRKQPLGMQLCLNAMDEETISKGSMTAPWIVTSPFTGSSVSTIPTSIHQNLFIHHLKS